MIRNSAKAIILEKDKILLIKISNKENKYFILPGGGQEKFETLQQTVIRECMEETGYHVKVLDIMFIRDYIARNHEFALINPEFHQVEFMFNCRIDHEKEKRECTVLDHDQVGIEWVALNEILSVNLYPGIIREKIVKFYKGEKIPIYLGDIN
ncbi:MAG: NUDIX domain-containing protein [Bacteriovorax sp.]